MKTSRKQKYSKAEIGALADAFNKSFITVERWVNSNDDRLTSEKAKNALQLIRGNQEVKSPNVQVQFQ